MNLYFIYEGKTEKKVFPAWFRYLLPRLQRVTTPDEVGSDSYYLIGGGGFPYIYDLIEGAAADLQANPKYHYLVVGLDADALDFQEKICEVEQFVYDSGLSLAGAELFVLPQQVCVETWFLSNRRVIPRNPQDPRMINYVGHYDVRADDPELMGAPEGWCGSLANFHYEYLKAAFAERGLRYSKVMPGHVRDEAFLKRLKERVSDSPRQCGTLRRFFEFTEMVSNA